MFFFQKSLESFSYILLSGQRIICQDEVVYLAKSSTRSPVSFITLSPDLPVVFPFTCWIGMLSSLCSIFHFHHQHFTAAPRQKGITDNFVKIELSPLSGPEWQYLSEEIIKHPILDLWTLNISVQKMSFMYKPMGAKHSNWKLSQNNQYVSYAPLSLGAE